LIKLSKALEDSKLKDQVIYLATYGIENSKSLLRMFYNLKI